MASLLLGAQTGTGTSTKFLGIDKQLPVSVSCEVAGAETATLQFYNGVNWVDFYKDGESSPVQITTTNSMISVWGTGIFRVVKSATAAAVPVYLHTISTP